MGIACGRGPGRKQTPRSPRQVQTERGSGSRRRPCLIGKLAADRHDRQRTGNSRFALQIIVLPLRPRRQCNAARRIRIAFKLLEGLSDDDQRKSSYTQALSGMASAPKTIAPAVAVVVMLTPLEDGWRQRHEGEQYIRQLACLGVRAARPPAVDRQPSRRVHNQRPPGSKLHDPSPAREPCNSN